MIRLKYLSCPSKIDLDGRGKSIFSPSGHGETLVEILDMGYYSTSTLLCPECLHKALFCQHPLSKLAKVHMNKYIQSVNSKGVQVLYCIC